MDNLQHLAVKLFSIVPNSMADERTVSVFTWLNSRLRSAQSVGTLVEQTQIRQWHRRANQVIMMIPLFSVHGYSIVMAICRTAVFKSPLSLTLLASENTAVKLMQMRSWMMMMMMMTVLREVTPAMNSMYHPWQGLRIHGTGILTSTLTFFLV